MLLKGQHICRSYLLLDIFNQIWTYAAILIYLWQHNIHTEHTVKSYFHWESYSEVANIQSCSLILIFSEMNFSTTLMEAKLIQTIPTMKKKYWVNTNQKVKMTSIYVIDYRNICYPKKNERPFKSFSKCCSDYIGNQKLKIDFKYDSFRIAYNSFNTILLNKAKPEILHI